MQEELSLATFEPNHAQPPYLNSPRSIEACRIHGVNPIELAAVPYEEFRKGFPNDDDAARRRFDRIDGTYFQFNTMLRSIYRSFSLTISHHFHVFIYRST